MQCLTKILIITLFLISCKEPKSVKEKTDSIEIEKEKTEALQAKVENSETDHSGNAVIGDVLTPVEGFNLFLIRDVENQANRKAGFISLSDIYPLSEHPDSLAVPETENADQQNVQYIHINSTYRKRLLSKTRISESDSVFIYDYSTDALLSFPVQKLNAVAYLNEYMTVFDCPCNQYDYMIGFEVDKSKLIGLGKNYSEALVFIGRENPFIKGQMKAIAWQKINQEKFPRGITNQTTSQKQYKHKGASLGQAYFYEMGAYQVFIQDYTGADNPAQVQDRHLMVIDKKSGNVVNDIMFNNTEGTSVAPLNFGINNPNYANIKIQWMGKLFKHRPEVIFGFEWVSFGCPSIFFMNAQGKYIQIHCDNRH